MPSNLIAVGAGYFAPGKGGVARVARLTAVALRKSTASLRLISLHDTDPIADVGDTVLYANGAKSLFALQCNLAAFRASHIFFDHPAIAQSVATLPASLLPSAVWIHGSEIRQHPLRRSVAAGIRRARLVLVNSLYTLREFEALHGPLPAARVCPLGTETDSVFTPARQSDRAPAALIVGRIETTHQTKQGKGHHELVDAWPRVVGAIPNAALHIVGGGTGLAALRARVDASSVSSHIHVHGFLSEHELEKIWSSVDVFVMPSHREGFGLVYIEAMQRGVPVVASIHDAGGEINRHGQTGFNVDLFKRNDLADRLIALLSDPKFAATMGLRGQAVWQANYTFAAFQKRFDAAIGDFVTTRHS